MRYLRQLIAQRLEALFIEQASAAKSGPRHRTNTQLLQLIERAVEQQRLMHRRDFDLIGGQGKRQARLQKSELGWGKVRYAKVAHFSAVMQREERLSHFIGIH